MHAGIKPPPLNHSKHSKHSLEARHHEVAEVPAEVTLDADAEVLVFLLELDARSEWPDRRTLELLRQSEPEATVEARPIRTVSAFVSVVPIFL